MKAKSSLLFLLFLLWSTTSICQTKILQYNFSKKPEKLKVYNVSNEAENVYAITLIQPDTVRHLLVNSNKIISEQFCAITVGKKQPLDSSPLLKKSIGEIYQAKYLGGILSGDTMEEYFLQEDSNRIITLSTNFTTGKTIIEDTLSTINKFATAFSQDNIFYGLGYIDETNQLILYKKRLGYPFIRLVTDVNLSSTDLRGNKGEEVTAKFNSLSDFFKYTYAVIQNPKDYSLRITVPHNKIYIYQNQIILTWNNQYHTTVALEVSLNDLRYNIKKYPQPGPDPSKHVNNSFSFTNSLIIDSLLIQANVINKAFNLSITNRETGVIYKMYSGKKSEKPDSINGNIDKTETFDKKSYTSPSSFEAFLGDLETNNSIAITAVRKADTLDVSVGTPFIIHSASFGEVFLSLALTSLGTYGINSIPGTCGFAAFSFSHESYNNDNVCFHYFFNDKTFEHIPGSPNTDHSITAIHEFILKNNIKDNATFLIQSKEQYYLGYYQKKENSYVVYVF